jgi:aconitate hydratase
MDFDLTTEPLGPDRRQQPVYLRDIWPTPPEVEEVVDQAIAREMFTDEYADVFAGDERWRRCRPRPATPSPGTTLDLRPQAPVLRRHAARARAR